MSSLTKLTYNNSNFISRLLIFPLTRLQEGIEAYLKLTNANTTKPINRTKKFHGTQTRLNPNKTG